MKRKTIAILLCGLLAVQSTAPAMAEEMPQTIAPQELMQGEEPAIQDEEPAIQDTVPVAQNEESVMSETAIPQDFTASASAEEEIPLTDASVAETELAWQEETAAPEQETTAEFQLGTAGTDNQLEIAVTEILPEAVSTEVQPEASDMEPQSETDEITESVETEYSSETADEEELVLTAEAQPMEPLTVYDVLGVWEGNYTESINGVFVQKSIRLGIEECTEDGKLNGTAIITSENNEEYYVEGTVEFVTGSIAFEEADLLENPDRPIFPLFSGILHLEDMTITGVVDEDDNKPFTLSKVSYDYATISTQADRITVINAPDYDVWLANTMLYGYENSGNGLYTTFQSFSEPVYMELGGYLLDDVPLVSMSTAWSVYFNSEYRDQFANEQKYIYEVILMEYLKYDSGYKAVKNELMNNEMKFSMKLYKTLAGELSDNTLDYISNMTLEEATSLFEKTKVIDQIGTAISELKDGVDSVKDLINVFSEYMALQQVRDERVYMLRAARNACASSKHPNSDFIKAADELINIIEGSTLQYVQGKSLDYLWKQGCDYAWDKLCDANPILKSIELGVSGLNMCFDSTDAASNNLKLALLYTTDCYLKQGMMNAASDFREYRSSVNAQTFLACFQAYVQFQMYGNDFAKTWLNGYLDGGIISNFVNMIFYRENISTAKEMIDRSETQTSNRKNILQLIDKYSNLYQHLYKDIDWEEISYDANVPVTGVNFSNPQITLVNKNSIFLAYANIEPANATNKNITYTSSYPSILSVPENGGFGTILGEGTVTITAKTEDGGYIATQTVTVKSCTAPSSEASGSCGTNAEYTLYDDGTVFVYGKGEIFVDDYNNITHHYHSDEIKDVIVCEGITELGNAAFYGCNNLESISLPDGLTRIGEEAFYKCGNLKEIILPESITRIEEEAFWNCLSLESINFPENLTFIGTHAFWCCKSLKNAVLPNGLTDLEAGAFDSCISLESVTLPEGLTSIESMVFDSCRNLTSINLPEGVTSIGHDAFYQCKKLKNITLPESLQSIDNGAFFGCSSLTSIYLPQKIASVGECAFTECNNIKEINLSKAVIGQWHDAFEVENVESITLEEDITNIGRAAFCQCRNLKTINIPHAVESIEEYAFWNCTSLTDIVLSEELTTIGDYAFIGCSNLKNINLPKGVISIGKGAFEDCSNLISIEIPQGLMNIGNNAFQNCSSLISINLPEGITHIGFKAFENCSSLKKIIIPQGVEAIESYVFSKCSSLESISLPKGVISIGSGAFENCISLTNVDLSEGLISIDDYAFRNCSSLKKIIIPQGVEAIESYVFSKCSSLESISLPKGVISIGSGAFEDCISLSNINFPEGVMYIEHWAFKGCISLTNVNLPEGLCLIEYSAFMDCAGLVSISIPASVTGIGYDGNNDPTVFAGCSENLTIIGRKGSCAAIYAHNQGINFEEAPCTEHVYKTVIIKTATCITNGQSCDKCIICNNIKPDSSKSIPATGHKYGLWGTTKTATVMKAGEQTRTCSVCGAKQTKSIAKLKAAVKLNVKKIPLQVKKTFSAKAYVTGLQKGDSIKTWTSSKPKVATVDKKTGKVTAKKKGTAVITVTTAGGAKAKFTVTVQTPAVKTTAISGLKKSASVKISKTITLKPAITPVTSQDKVTYASSNKKVATVSAKGVVKGLKAGTAKITVKSGKKKFVVTVKVTRPAVTAIKNVPKNVKVKKGKTYTLKPKFSPAGSSGSLKYTSSNKKVATVNAKGKITAKKKGTATITVQTGKIKVTCKVTVK